MISNNEVLIVLINQKELLMLEAEKIQLTQVTFNGKSGYL